MASTVGLRPLDLDIVRAQFPVFDTDAGDGFFENAGGSFACRQTIDALSTYYTETKVQPYASYASSATAGRAMDRSRERWAEALGVATDEVVFGPSTSINTYVLAQAFSELIGPGDEVIVTNQDHEANTGVFRRMAERVGATVTEWRIDPTSGLLDVDQFASLVGSSTKLVTVPHTSNIIGQENDVTRVCELAHAVGARVVVDGVSFAPHAIPDVTALGADVYLFSMYKTYSVHQGLMTVRADLLDELPNQSHYFNGADPSKRLNPAGPDHAQVAAAGAVLDYVELLHTSHGGDASASLRSACAAVSNLWAAHEDALTAQLLGALADTDAVRVLGTTSIDAVPGHRSPTIAFSPLAVEPAEVTARLVASGIKTNNGHFYAQRVLEGVGVDPDRGVVRLSFVHYTSPADIDRVCEAVVKATAG